MKNKATTTYKWAYLPFVFSSAAILATSVNAAPGASQQYQDAKQTSQANYEYVGGKTQVGVGVTDDGDATLDINQVISESKNSSTSVGLWGEYDLKGDDKGFGGRGAQVNHNWVSRDKAGRATHVNKVFGAYDRNRDGHDKATVGYGQENENLFWEGHVSKGLSDKIASGRTTGPGNTGKKIYNQAYEYGVGGSVGTFLPNSNVRVRAGLDHEWGEDYEGEERAKNTTLSAGVEKFFQGTPHSLALDVAASKRSGGYEGVNSIDDDTDVTGKLSYRYDFGGASIYQPDRRYRRVRVEVPGQGVPPRYAKKAQFKRVQTYKSVPVFGTKTVRTPYKQLVKSTMELEGQTFFKLNSSKIIPSAQTRLKQIAAQIRKNGYKGSIRITGNTCGLGSAKYDQILSEKRANAVKRFLIANGFNANRLVARGLGKGHPKYPNTPDQGFKNRRVDIEYVSERKAFKTGYKTEQKRVQTGTRKVASGFKNVPAGFKNVMIDSGRAGAPRVIWKTEAIATSPAWVTRALHNNIRHNTNVNTFETLAEGAASDNKAPNAVNDSSTIQCNNGPVTINVLGNDSDPENDNLTITNVTNGQFGTTKIVNGQVVYTPNPGTAGCGQTDTFSYTVSDGNGNSSTATVNVIINEENNLAPVAVNDSATTEAGQPVALNTLANDSDPEGDTLTIISVQQPANGTAEIVGGQIVYTPNAGFVGTESFTYTISDGHGNTATATETVTVTGGNSDPIAVNDSVTTDVNTPVTLDTVANDSDPDGDNLTITNVQQPTNGTAVISADGKTILYTPNAGFVGTDRFTYTISDGNGGTAQATETVVINAPDDNKAPVAVNDSSSVQCNNGPVTIDVLSNDSDPENDNLTITNVNNGQFGTTEIVNGKVVYTPNPGTAGCGLTDTFSYTISDGNGNTSTATVSVVIGEEDNKAPIAVNDSATTAPGQPVALNTLANDSDPENDPLTITSVQQPANGTAEIVGGQIVYTPNAGFVGTESFTYTISDGNGNTATATETVTVVAPDDVKAANDLASTDEDTPVTIDVLSNDDSDASITRIVTNPSNGTAQIVGGQIVYTPNPGFSGTDTFTYEVRDPAGNLATAQVTVTVKDGNKPPVAVNDSATTDENTPVTLNTVANDSDPDGDNLTITNVQQPANGTAVVSADGKRITYTPNAGFFGTESFTYTISDGNGGTDTATETVTVRKGNDKPNAVNDSATTDENTPVTLNTVANDSDPDGDNLTITNVQQPANGTAVVSADGKRITYTPNAGFFGTESFTYTISDGNGGTDTATETVTVRKGNDKPNAVNDSATTDENTPVTLNTVANDSDPDGDNLTITNVQQPANGTAVVSADGKRITYTPNAGFSGTESFSYTISDGNGGTDTATETVTVNPVNKAPNAVDDLATAACSAITINVLGNDLDPDGDALSIINVSAASLGSAVASGGQIVYTPSNTCGKGNTGLDSFTYTISDGNGGTDTATVKVDVKGITDGGGKTKAEPDDASTLVDQPVRINVLSNDAGNGLKIISVDSPKNGTAKIVGGAIEYTPAAGFTGTDSFWYDIVDENGYNDSALILVYVEEGGKW